MNSFNFHYSLKSEKEHMESLIKYDTEINALHNSQGKLEIELDNLKVQYKNLQVILFI